MYFNNQSKKRTTNRGFTKMQIEDFSVKNHVFFLATQLNWAKKLDEY